MENEAPESSASDNTLLGGYEPQQSAVPAQEQGQAAPETSEWHASYSEDFRSLLDKKGLTGLSQQEATESLAKSYTNLESMRNVPDDNLFNISTDMDEETRDKLYSALGRPESADKYSYETQETDSPELVDHFKSVAHKYGLTDSQFSEMLPELNEKIIELAQSQQNEIHQRNVQNLESLRRELGSAWDSKVNIATRAAEHFGISQEIQQAVVDAGYSAEFIQALTKVGSSMAEGEMVGMSPVNQKAAMGVLSPDEAKAEINAKLSNKDFLARYHSQDQATRVAASKELSDLRKARIGK